MIEGILIGAGVFMAGMVTGRWWPARHKRPEPHRAAKPVCGCEHHHSYHDPQTGQCHGTNRKVKYSAVGADLGYHEVPCTCRQYTGPEPLPEYYAPELPS